MKKCKYCDNDAVGVIPSLLYHWYVCEAHAKKEEEEGWYIDYETYNLSSLEDGK